MMKKIGMLFPGYGSQYVGMGKDLYDKSRTVQEYFEEASHCLDTNFVKLCFASSDNEISKITNAYTALFLTGVSTAKAIQEAGIKIDLVAGHGLGEYSALCAAGGLTFPDGLYILSKLGKFYSTIIQNMEIKSILISGISSKEIEEICKGKAHVAVYENKLEHKVSGESAVIDELAKSLISYSNKVKIINSNQQDKGFHTPLLNELLKQLTIYLTKIDFKDLKIPLITSINGKEAYSAQKIQDGIMGQITKPIYWNAVMKKFAECEIIMISAPAKILIEEIQFYYPKKQIIGISSMADIDKVVNQL